MQFIKKTSFFSVSLVLSSSLLSSAFAGDEGAIDKFKGPQKPTALSTCANYIRNEYEAQRNIPPEFAEIFRRILENLHRQTGIPLDQYKYKIFSFPVGLEVSLPERHERRLLAVYGGGVALLWDPTMNQFIPDTYFLHDEEVRDVFQLENHWGILTVGKKELYIWNGRERPGRVISGEELMTGRFSTRGRRPNNFDRSLGLTSFFGVSAPAHLNDSILNVAQASPDTLVVEWTSGAIFRVRLRSGHMPIIERLTGFRARYLGLPEASKALLKDYQAFQLEQQPKALPSHE